MKISKLLEDNYSEIKAANTKGKSLAALIKDDYVTIYRAQPVKHLMLPSDSYVTRSLKFAKEHAVHMANTEEESYHVIRAFVKTLNVYEANNPGEYIYNGEPAKSRSIFVANPGDDFVNESRLSEIDYQYKLERKLNFILNLKKNNEWEELHRYELEQNLVTNLLKLAHRFRDSGQKSSVVDNFFHSINSNIIELIRNVKTKENE